MTTEQVINVSFDGWSALFFVILLIGVIVTRRLVPLQAKALMGLLVVSILLNASEVVAYVFRGNTTDFGFFVVRVSNFLVFLANHLILLFAGFYIIFAIEKKGGHVPKAFKVVFVGVLVTGVVLLALSRPLGFYYAFDEMNRYYRLGSYWVMLALEGISVLMIAVLTIVNWKCLMPLDRAAFLMLEFLPVVAIGLQLFTYGISLTTFASTICIAMIFITFELDCSHAIVMRERNLLDEIIVALAQAVDAKDAYTNGHSNRVAKYSRMIAEKMGMNRQEADRIFRMAVLHDVGKIGIPDEILNKPAKLTDEEYRLIQGHTVQGYEILKGITSMPELGMAARQHHERADGKGYPNALRGQDISLEARIIGVADSYDAMTSDRAYRKMLSQEKARQEIIDNMGTQFDSEAAKAMLEIIDEDTEYKLHG